MIDINTRFITLIGTPLGQSFAARMQNRAYEAMGMNMHYFYTETDSDHLKEIIDGIRNMPSFIGCAVTKPNKVEVLKYLDELDPFCEKMGACNSTQRKQAECEQIPQVYHCLRSALPDCRRLLVIRRRRRCKGDIRGHRT